MNDAGARPGVRVGVDVGTVRVGVAASDPGGVLAVPVTTLARDRRGGGDIDQLVLIIRDRQAVEVVVGLPRQMSGQEGRAVQLVRQYAAVLAERIAPIPVRFVDERLTTVAAHRRMAERGVRSRARRNLVDQEAAVQILQHDLDSRRGGGSPGVVGSAQPHPVAGRAIPPADDASAPGDQAVPPPGRPSPGDTTLGDTSLGGTSLDQR